MNIMPTVWLLNLERSKDRLHFMQDQLSRLQIPYEVFSAVDGQMLPDDQLTLYSRKDALRCCEREMSPGEIGCALSHAIMWQRMLDEDLDEVLVLEDDILLGEMMLHVLASRDRLPEDWELINFMTDVGQLPFGEPIYDIYRACNFSWHANRTSAYLLKRQGAQKLLKHVYPIRWTADGFTGRQYITGVVSYGIDPRVVTLRDFDSEIWKGTDITSLERPLTYRLLSFARRVINWLSYLCSKAQGQPR